MASITIRKLDDAVKSRLRIRAARHGRSMEEEAREILKLAVVEKRSSTLNLAESIRRHIGPLGGVDLAVPSRQRVRRPPGLTR
jgi:plasmid stability protein